MNYSVQSLYDVIREELANHEFLTNEFANKKYDIIINMLAYNGKHFDCLGGMYFPNNAFAEFVDGLAFVTTDYVKARGKESLELGFKLAELYIHDHMNETDKFFYNLIIGLRDGV